MVNRYVAAVCLSLVALPGWCQQEGAPAAPDTPSEKVLIVGERPGPGMWKVSKGDHVLWIFGTYSPLPQKMTWRSQAVERVIANSQEFIGPPGASMSVGFKDSLNLITALPFLVGLKKNTDGARLQDSVPPDVYARWTVLKAKYIGEDSGIEEERPMFAAETLFARALARSGLGKDQLVVGRVQEFGKKYKLKYTSANVAVPLDNPRQALRDFKKTRLDDIACFTRTIDRLETDLDAMRLRANAWAIGDVERMRTLTYPDQEESCRSAMLESSWMRAMPGGGNLKQRIRETWLAAAEKSLAANRSTFSMMSVSQIMNPDGLVAALQAKGYKVEDPE